MAAPSSASGWTNSGNVIANDGAFAEAQASLDEGFPLNSPSLTAIGFGFTGGAGDSVSGIVVQVNCRRSAGALGATLVVYLLNNGTPVGNAKSAALGTGFTTLTFGSSTDNWGTSFNGGNVGNLQVGCYVEPASGSGSPTVSGNIDWLTAAVTLIDTTPNAFTFTDQTGVGLGTVATSNSVQITGISGPATVTIWVGEYEINNSGNWTSVSGSINNNDYIRVRHTASSTNGGIVASTLTVGGVSDDFTSTAASSDTTPDPFDFNDASGVDPSVGSMSNAITISGINAATSWSISAGVLQKNGVNQPGTSGTLVNGDQLAIILTSSASFGASVTSVLTVGGVTGDYVVTTRAANTTPNEFAFTDVSGAATSTLQTSNSVTISGIEAAAAISITGGEYEIGGSGTWLTTASTISNGQTVRVRHTSAASVGQSVNTVLTVGGRSDTFTSTTSTGDSVPDAFTFGVSRHNRPGVLVESGPAIISGINVSVAVTCTPGADFSIAGGAYSTSGTITNGQSIKVRVRSRRAGGASETASVTIGGVVGNFLVFTARLLSPDF